MDTLTHCVAGGLTPLLFQRAPKRTALVVFGIFAGELPDIDAFFGSGSPEGLMLVHRGLTHALAFQPFLMLAYVVPFFIYLSYRYAKSRPGPLYTDQGANLRADQAVDLVWAATAPASPTSGNISPVQGHGQQLLKNGAGGRLPGNTLPGNRLSGNGLARSTLPALSLLFVIALFAQYIHVFLDSVTTFGTRIFLPFSSQRVDFPGMFIIDLFLLIPITVLWVWALRATPAGEPFWSRKSRYIARVAMAWLILYPLGNIGMNYTLVGIYAKEHGVPREQVALFTEPFTPFAWKKVVWEGEWCTMQTVFPLSKGRSTISATYRVPDPSLLANFASEIPLFAVYQEFAPTLVLTDVIEDLDTPLLGQQIFRFADVRYITSPQSPARSLGISSTSFGFEIKTSHSRVVAYRYLDSLETGNAPWVAVRDQPYSATSTPKNLSGNELPEKMFSGKATQNQVARNQVTQEQIL